MKNKVKNKDNIFPTWVKIVAGICILLLGLIIFLTVALSSVVSEEPDNNNSSNSYSSQNDNQSTAVPQKTMQESEDNSSSNSYSSQNDNQSTAVPQKTRKEPEDNRLSCPIGNEPDSGQKVDDWFECSIIKKIMNREKSNEKIDCSKPENYNKQKIYFAISTICKKDSTILLGTFCEEQGGTIKTIVQSQSYPSLNEYYFNSISTEFENLGCTKVNPDDYVLIYSLYQNGKRLASKIDDESIKNVISLLGDDDYTIYPEDMILVYLGFGTDPMFPTAIEINDPNGFTFKVCLIDTTEKTIVSCDKADFNIEYESIWE